MRIPELRRGLAAGAVAGAVLVAAMYLLGPLAGLRPLPQLLQQPILDLMPGAVFGFLIDTLQHAGKVVEELSLILTMIAGLAVLGGIYGYLRRTRTISHLAMIFAAIAWLVVVGVLLPASGDGWFGLLESFTAPLLWAVLFLLYAVILEGAYDNWLAPRSELADPGRRQMLRAVPLAIAGGSLLLLGFELVPRWYKAIFAAPSTGPTAELTPIGDFYVVSKNFTDPIVDAAGWELNIHGLVDKPQRFKLADLRAMAAVTEYVTLECISNNVGGYQISTGLFGGIPLGTVLDLAGVQPGATLIAFRSRDGYTESLPLSLIRQSPEILLALTLDGRPLPDVHGFPARILVPGHYGMKGPKWVEDIELATGSRNGYWENQGWNPDAAVKTMSRIDSPPEGSLLKAGAIDVSGVAFAGKRGISGVEISADGGRSWLPAVLKPPLSNLTWVTWTASWTVAAAGQYRLQVRAHDGAGALQVGAASPSYPDGSSGLHSVQVSVTSR
ncbi:MAG: molybdopterin-dependent oxidoreductase [Candidatus Dormibacteraeota bacterium]|nr:molybdopterin-dependent oxidoreductase [Candidatus Dormibacteraeota bacterium]